MSHQVKTQTTEATSQASLQTMNQSANAELVALAKSMLEKQNTPQTLKDKLKSRKFWLATAGCAAGLCGMIGFNDNITAIVVFAVLEVVSIVAYCISEGMVDSTRVTAIMEAIITIVEMSGGSVDAEKVAQDAVNQAKEEIAAEEAAEEATNIEDTDKDSSI